MTNKEFYRQQDTKDLPLFHQPFWLDAVAGENWDVALVKDGDAIIASMPYALEHKWYGTLIRGPHLTQFLGPYFHQQKITDKKICNEVVALLYKQLPPFVFYNQRWHFSLSQLSQPPISNLKIEKRITHILQLEAGLQDKYSDNRKREISRAEKNIKITGISANDFFQFTKTALEGKKYRTPFSLSLFERLYDARVQQKARKIFAAIDSTGKVSAAIFIAWDQYAAYYIIGARSIKSGNDGAMTLLFHESFKFLSGKVTTFDFEGSMIPGIASYFKSFGAEIREYNEITITPSWIGTAGRGLKKMIHR